MRIPIRNRPCICTIIFLLFLNQFTLASKKNADVESMLARAAQSVDLRAPGSPAFRLHATVQISNTGHPPESGSYSIEWITADQWQESIVLPGFSQTRIAFNDKLWADVKGGPPPASYWQLQKLMQIPQEVALATQRLNPGDQYGFWYPHAEKIRHVVRHKQLLGVAASCIDIDGFAPASERTTCLDSTMVAPLFVTEKYFGNRLEFRNYTQLGPHKYPKQLSLFHHGHLELQIQVTELTTIAPASLPFQSPAGGHWEPWCTQVPPVLLLLRTNNLSVMPRQHFWAPELWDGHNSWAMLYGVLGIDGRWRDLKVLKAEPAEAGQAALVTLPHSVLSPPACGIRNVQQPAAIIVTFAWYGGILPPKQ